MGKCELETKQRVRWADIEEGQESRKGQDEKKWEKDEADRSEARAEQQQRQCVTVEGKTR